MTPVTNNNSQVQLNNSLALVPMAPRASSGDSFCAGADRVAHRTREVGAQMNTNIKSAIATVSEGKERGLVAAGFAVNVIRAGGAWINHMAVWGTNALSKLKEKFLKDAAPVAQQIVNLVRSTGNNFNEIAKEGKSKIDALADAVRTLLSRR